MDYYYDKKYACYVGSQPHSYANGKNELLIPESRPYYPSQVFTYNRMIYGKRSFTPDVFINNFNKKEYSPRKIEKNTYTGEWFVKERDNGRTIIIGKFILKRPLLLNPMISGEFEGGTVCVEYEGKDYDVVFTGKEYRNRRMLQHFSFFKRNPDCPEKYIIDAIYLAFQELKDWKFLYTPKFCGWQELPKGKPFFASNLSVYTNLEEYYPSEVRQRQLLSTDRPIFEIAKEYAEKLPKIWQYKLLVAIRLSSLTLYFANKEGIKPDQLFVVESGSESAAKFAISLLKTQNYTSLSSLSLMATKTQLNEYLRKINDGIALFSDNSYVEDRHKRGVNVDILIDDLYNRNGIEYPSRHCIAIVSDNPGNLPSEIPAMYIDLSNVVTINDIETTQKLTGEFDSAFINVYEIDPNNMCALLNQFFKTSEITKQTISNSEKYNSERLVRIGVCIMEQYGLITKDEISDIFRWLGQCTESSRDSATMIINDFRRVLNSVLFSAVKVCTQYGAPYYIARKGTMCIIDDKYLNFELQAWDRFLIRMKTTKKRQKVLHALADCNMIYANNGFKRMIDVEVAPGIIKKVSVYSISKKIIDLEKLEKLDELFYANYYFTEEEASIINLRQMITNKSRTMLCGQYMNLDLNYHQLISGDSRSGKTTYECEQAVASAINDEPVLVIDNDGSWSEHILKEHFSNEIVEKYFSFWSIPNQGIPINLADLSNCKNLPEKKNLIFSILYAAANGLGEQQAKVLKKQIGTMLKERNDFNISDILNYLDEKDDIQKAISEKLYHVFQDFEGLPKTNVSWHDFLYSHNKIIVISTGADTVAKESYMTDILLSSFYAYKQYHPETRTTIILDEIQDLDISSDSAIDIILRKGAKRGIRMLLATHEFSAVRDTLGKIFGNCRTLVFFKPKHDDVKEIARITGVDVSILAELEQGQCVVYGLLYNREEKKNKQTTIIGWTYNHHFSKPEKTALFIVNDKKSKKNRIEKNITKETQGYYSEQNRKEKYFKWIDDIMKDDHIHEDNNENMR